VIEWRAEPVSTAGQAREENRVRWDGPDGYWACDDPERIDVAFVAAWLSENAFWARGRPAEVVARSVENSVVIGLFDADGAQVGFARIVTDQATFGWLCDVFVDAEHEGRGLGSFLVESTLAHPFLRGVRLALCAEPGRSLYRQHGFVPLTAPERWMQRDPW
jgi:GNAT superfamily N-acetyltransferase